MKYLLSVIILASLAVTAYCGEGLPLFFRLDHWHTLTNAANFHETYSTTNIPPELLRYILEGLGRTALEREHAKRMAEPGEPLIHGSRLVWAATDNTNWAVHYECVFEGLPMTVWTNYYVSVELLTTNAAPLRSGGGYMRRFKAYRDFVRYESDLPYRGLSLTNSHPSTSR